jgi:hypothetical protein
LAIGSPLRRLLPGCRYRFPERSRQAARLSVQGKFYNEVVERIAAKAIAMLREKNYLSEEGVDVDVPPCLDQVIEDS